MELEEDCADFAGVPLLASLREKLRIQLEGVKSVSDELSSIERMIQDLMQKREDKMYEVEDRKSEADITQTKINDCKRESLCRLQSLKKRYNYVGSSFSLFDLLPSDLFVHIFKYFTPKDLCFAVMRTSRHFHTMAQSDAIWAFVFSLSFGPIITTDGCKTCKNLSLSRFSSSHSSHSSNSSTHSSSSSLSSKNNGCVDSPLGKRWGRERLKDGDGDGDALMGDQENINNGNTINNKGNGKVGSVSWLAGFKHRNEVERNWKESKWTASTLHGHTDWVTCLMVVDEFLISGSFDASIKIWDLETKECRITLSGHTAGINAIDISGEVLLSASLDSTLRVWNLSTNTCTAVLEGHTDQVSHVNFFTPRQQKQQLSSLSSLSPLSLYAVTGSLDGTLRVWDIKASKCMHVLEGHTTGITSMTLCHQYAASGSVDGRIVVWDCLQGTKIFELLGHGDRISGLQFDFATSRLVSCSWDFTVRVWDLKTGICINILQGHVFRIRCLSLKDNILVTGSWDSDIKVWDLSTGTCIRTLSGHSNYVWGCELQAGGKHVVSSSWDKTVRVWDSNNGRLLSTLDHDSEVLCLHSSSHRIIGASKEIKIWDYSVK